MSSFCTNWDVNKYHDPAEFKDHWNLRKAFMLTHKNKFPEERLAGLARIFYNMEFLGCVYKSEIMILVQNLAGQVDTIVQYRNKKKMKLQRTFVKASDAVKRHINKTNTTVANNPKMQYVNFVPAKNSENNEDDDEEESKRLKIDPFIDNPELMKYAENIKNPSQHFAQPEADFVNIGQQYMTKNQFMPVGYVPKPQQYQPQLKQPQPQFNQPQPQFKQPQPQFNQPQPQFQQVGKLSKTQPQSQQIGTLSKSQQKKQAWQQLQEQKKQKYKLRFDLKPKDRELIMKVKNQNGILGKMILYETQAHATPYGRFDYSASKVNINTKIVKDEINKKYILYMDEELITEVPICEQPVAARKVPKGHRKFKIPDDARNEIAEKAFAYLKQYCFTLIEHNTTKNTEQISTDNLKNTSKPTKQFELSMDGIGAKMMKQMGWDGKGLGKDANGIIEPIQAEIRVYRRGFGQGSDEAFTKSVRNYFENYLMSGETKRLVFSTDFSKDDRAKLHTIAGQFGLLRSRSYGKDENRHITIERKLSGWDIIEQVLANGGSNDCYTLIKPTNIY